MKWENLSRGVLTVSELSSIEELKFELNNNIFELARQRLSGRADAGLERLVAEQQKALAEANSLKKKHGVPDFTPRRGELEAVRAEFKALSQREKSEALEGKGRGAALLARMSEIAREGFERRLEIAEKTIALKKPREPTPIKPLPAAPGLVARVIHGRRQEYVREEDAGAFDENEGLIRRVNAELQAARLKGDSAKCAELEAEMSRVICVREDFLARAEELAATVAFGGDSALKKSGEEAGKKAVIPPGLSF